RVGGRAGGSSPTPDGYGSPCVARCRAAAEPKPLAAITAIADAFPPGAIVDVPVHRLFEPGLEGFLRTPAEFAPDLGRVDGIAQVVAGSVGHEFDQFLVPARRIDPVEDRADPAHDIDVGPLGIAADIVLLADAAPIEDEMQRAGMILDMQPVATVLAAAIDRQ